MADLGVEDWKQLSQADRDAMQADPEIGVWILGWNGSIPVVRWNYARFCKMVEARLVPVDEPEPPEPPKRKRGRPRKKKEGEV